MSDTSPESGRWRATRKTDRKKGQGRGNPTFSRSPSPSLIMPVEGRGDSLVKSTGMHVVSLSGFVSIFQPSSQCSHQYFSHVASSHRAFTIVFLACVQTSPISYFRQVQQSFRFQIFLFMHYFNSLLQKEITIHHKSNILTTLNYIKKLIIKENKGNTRCPLFPIFPKCNKGNRRRLHAGYRFFCGC